MANINIGPRNLQGDAVFDRVFWDELFLPDRTCSYAPVSSYVSSSNKKCPHIMFSMKHDIKEQDNLLRGEFLAIVAAMITRLERFSSAQQLYIPVREVYPSIHFIIYFVFFFSLTFFKVLVFSFMGHLQGRILQAYYDGTSVVIKKTKFYHFLPENSRGLLNLFVQQMANTPIGNTKGVPAVSTKKTPPQQSSSQGLSLRQKPSNIR